MKNLMENDIEKILFDNAQINKKIKELARQIEKDYKDKDLVTVCVLNGASVFYSNLILEINIPLEMNFIRVSSYGHGTLSSGNIRTLYDLETNINGKDVLIIEDIVDSGHTLLTLKNLFLGRGANTVRCCSLLDKPSRREVEIEPDYSGFTIPDEFIVGYGLDFAGKYRNLKYIGVLKPEIYK